MNPKKIFLLSIVLVISFSLIYIIYTIPQEVALGGEWYPSENISNPNAPRSLDELASRLYASIIAYLLIGVLTFYLFVNSYRASRLLSGLKRDFLLHLSAYFLLVSIAAFIQVIGIGLFVVRGISSTTVEILGLTLYVYPITIPISTMLISLSIIFIPLFGFIMSDKKYPAGLIEGILIALVILELFLLALPQNWFGCYVPYANGEPKYADIRPISVLVLLIIFLYGTLVTVFKVYRRIRITDDRITRFRLELLAVSLLLIDAYFIFYMIDSVIGGGFTMFMVFAVLSAIISFVGVYLAIVPPDWLITRLKAKYGE